jgi:hypothetical protein
MELVCSFFPFRRFVCNPFPAFCWDRMEYLYLGLSKNGLGVDFDGSARRIPPDGCWETNRAGARRFHTLPVPTGAGKIWVVCRRCPRGSAGRGCLPDRLFHGKPGGRFPPGHGLLFVGFQRRDISGRPVSGPVKMAACGPGCPSFLWKDAAFDVFGGKRPVFCHFVHGSSHSSMAARSHVCSECGLFRRVVLGWRDRNRICGMPSIFDSCLYAGEKGENYRMMERIFAAWDKTHKK